ncbi:MAG TPA: PEP/pyruvate-binding domain-containing protein [Ktedonobacteraceae bacterium]|nr:PEP/pyruvate-binding domain-containing protein [Ktedonobacteraceae bacterium]
MSSRSQSTLSQGREKEQRVLFFTEIDYSLLPLVGGKGANLGELTRAGLPVPPGFCIITEAYQQVAGRAELNELLDRLASKQGQTHSGEIAAAIRERLLQVAFPQELAASVRAAYLSLGKGSPLAVAVRSSATAEDLPFASFAGQQDTYLNIVGEDALLDAVRRCWASLWTERAVSYRMNNQIDPHTVSLAVVVQRMIDVAVAGVLFTANPLTGRRRQAVIDASPGLGEAVVSGATNPDHFVVNTISGEIVERRLGDKRVVIQAVPGGGTRRIERAEQSDHACLTDEQVRELAQLGAKVEAHYQAPQDTEWAIDTSGKLWLTQARPITTLYPLPANAPQSDDVLRVYFSFNVAQGVYQPITPMGLAFFRLIASALVPLAGFPPVQGDAGPRFVAEAGMRLFLDVTGGLRNPIGQRMINFVLPFAEARSFASTQVVQSDPRLQVVTSRRWSFIRRAIMLVTRLGIPPRVLQAIFRPAAARRRVLALREWLQQQLSPAPNANSLERLELVENFVRHRLIHVLASVGPILLGGILSFGLAGKLLGNLGTADERQTVLRGLPYNPTTEMDLALWSVAQQISANQDAVKFILEHSLEELSAGYHQQSLPPVVQNGLAEFLRTYGHRGVAEIDLGLPRWSEDPTHILGAIVNYLRLTDEDLAPDVQFARGAQQADAMVQELTKRAMKRNWLRGRLVHSALKRTRALMGMRELPKFYLVWVLARIREILRPVAEELVSAGRLQQHEDLYFLSFAEARIALAGTDMRPIVRERRAVYEQEMHRRHIPRVLLSDGSEPIAATEGDTGDALQGTPASAGRVTANARVILNPIGAHLEPGEILVAPSTDPGWTPLFLTAGGLVMEMGGSMSHGAVVAREYGIPAVVGVTGATEQIQNGQVITVDGSLGKIVLGDGSARQQLSSEQSV